MNLLQRRSYGDDRPTYPRARARYPVSSFASPVAECVSKLGAPKPGAVLWPDMPSAGSAYGDSDPQRRRYERPAISGVAQTLHC